MKVALIALIALTLSGCTDGSATRQALAEAGFTDIQVDGFAWLQCGKDDTYATAFRAKGPTGVPVAGAVCCGLFKGCTIRH